MRVNYRALKQTLFYDLEFLALSKPARDLVAFGRLMATNIIALYRPDWETLDVLCDFKTKDQREVALTEAAKLKDTGSPWALCEHGYLWLVNGFRFELGNDEDGIPYKPGKPHRQAVQRALDSLPSGLTLGRKFCQHYKGCGFGDEFDALLDTLSNTLWHTPVDREGGDSAPAPAPAPAPVLRGNPYPDQNSRAMERAVASPVSPALAPPPVQRMAPIAVTAPAPTSMQAAGPSMQWRPKVMQPDLMAGWDKSVLTQVAQGRADGGSMSASIAMGHRMPDARSLRKPVHLEGGGPPVDEWGRPTTAAPAAAETKVTTPVKGAAKAGDKK